MKINLKKYGEIFSNFDTIDNKKPGFHGDIYLINLVNHCLDLSTNFIETGTNIGTTLYFVSRNYNMSCYSCEMDKDKWVYHHLPLSSVIPHKNITFKNIKSPRFLSDIVEHNNNIINDLCVFWLDAHIDVYDPAQDIIFKEIEYIKNTFKNYFIFGDDVDINNSLFSNNGYSIDQIKQLLTGSDNLYIPDYDDQTSDFHDLTGWCLITNQVIDNIQQFKIKKYEKL